MQRTCDNCATSYEARRATSRYCSGACRTQAGRRAAAGGKPVAKLVPPAPSEVRELGPIEASSSAELSAAGRLTSSAGQRALALARLLDAPPAGTLGAVAGWSREHGAAMASALVNVEQRQAKSALELAREKRDAKRHA